jgi:ethanolamine ammonia-lyase small subunit
MTRPPALHEQAPTQLDHAPAELAPALATRLRSLTPARVGLRRTGTSIATNELLDFQLAHGRARDAVHAPLEVTSLQNALKAVLASFQGIPAEILTIHSQAKDRQTYLQRPDLGRTLDSTSHKRLQVLNESASSERLAIAVVDGLSSLAIERHAAPLLAELLPLLVQQQIQLSPISIVEQGRVAIGDEIGHALSASIVIVLIGERPGLSSPDSLGAYITWQPRPGRTDAERNCISNIRHEGLSYSQAASRLMHYIQAAKQAKATGIALKDPDETPHPILAPAKVSKAKNELA